MSSPAPEVRGLNLDPQTRCSHYHSPLDIIAIKMKCCATYYACKDCHEALAGHPIEVWPETEWNQKAILCGACRAELTISAYLRMQLGLPRVPFRVQSRLPQPSPFLFRGPSCA